MEIDVDRDILSLAHAHCYQGKLYLIDGLQHSDPNFRIACISALVTHWNENDVRIVSRLLEIAKVDSDSWARNLAMRSLGQLKAVEALPLLRRIVEDSETELDLRQVAYEAYVAIETPPDNFLELATENERAPMLAE